MNIEQIFELDKKIKDAEFYRRKLLLEMAGVFLEIKEKKLYKKLEPDLTWSGYLAQTELTFPRSQIYHLLQIYRKFIEELGQDVNELASIPSSRLIALYRIVNKENVKHIIAMAKTLLPSDFKKEVRQAKGLPIEDDCPHTFTQYEICHHCGEKNKLS